jgi:ABC-type multidrug transport system ATPase subunit
MLELRGLSKRFGRHEALRDVSLTVRPGEIYGLLGPNGSGKSTTLKIATGLVFPDRGDVRIGGVDLAQDRLAALRQIGAQIEAPAFPAHLSGRRNLQLLADVQQAPRPQADALLEQVGLGQAADRRVEGYSTGMRQRLGLAAALLGRPAVLILDEPTSGLDPEGREEMLALIAALARDGALAVLFTSHVFDEVARLCQRIGILQAGALVHEGPVQDADRLRQLYFGGAAPREAVL